MRSAATEAADPKYAFVERERRWRIDPARRPSLDGLRAVLIEDRYLTGTRCRLRRVTEAGTGETVVKLTRKYDAPDPLARPIVTAYLDEVEYALFATLPALPLTKRRYAVVQDGATWSVDRYEGALAGLETAEIEWPDDAGLRTLVAPAWFGRDVSTDPRYQGASLARHGNPRSNMAHILIVEARFYDHLNDMLLAGARAAIEAAGHSHETMTVPGALEAPGAIALAVETGRYDAFVALGVVIRGETYHFEIVSNESARGIMALTMDGIAIGNGILTTEDEAQAIVRADPVQLDKGGGAAKAALAMLALKERFG